MSPLTRALTYAGLIVCSLVFAAPFFWLVTSALKRPEQLMAYPIEWIPRPFMWSNFREAWEFRPFPLYLRNTLTIAVLTTIGSMLSSSLVAYGLTRIDWPGRRVLFIAIISTMMLPYQVVMVPLFTLFVKIGWIDTFKPLIVPSFFLSAYVYLLRGFFQAIPNDLSEAAHLDGASEFGIYWRVIMPLARPAIATVGLFAFIGAWNDFCRPAHLSRQRDELHPRPRPRDVPGPARHLLALPDGGLDPCHSPHRRPLLLHPAHVHSGDRADRAKGLQHTEVRRQHGYVSIAPCGRPNEFPYPSRRWQHPQQSRLTHSLNP